MGDVNMPRRAKYPEEVSIRIPKDITDLYETPVLKVLFTEREAEMAEKIIQHIKEGGRLWPDEWKEIVDPHNYGEIKAYYRTLRKMVSLGLLSRGKEGSFIFSNELSRKLTVLIEKINALIGKKE